MNIKDITYGHDSYMNILSSRGIKLIDKNMPLWKFKLTDEEYENLKKDLRCHTYELKNYGMEAALCYAEWWRRDYKGNIPSKEDVAMALGLSCDYAKDLFVAAFTALKEHGYSFIHSQKGTEYFRTLLNQGGIPINYIKSHDGGLTGFSRFLKGLVKELSIINYNWNDGDNSIIRQFNCISYLGNAFKNDNIYDVSMQIAHAIIMEDTDLLPYDDTDASLRELTKSLQNEYKHSQSERRVRPLSLHWKLRTEDGKGYLFMNMDVVKDISSDSIPRLNHQSCYQFDVFVAGTLVGKYQRKSVNKDNDGNVLSATYTRNTVGINKDILWKGESVVEVKIRCDNEDRLFLTIAGCYPPNFDYPQVFQMLDDNLYSKKETGNSEKNIVVFSQQWESKNAKTIVIEGQELYYEEYQELVDITNKENGEVVNLTNKFTQYSAEFSGNYISWVEKSNYKLLASIPMVRVYDKEKNKVFNCKTQYRIKNSSINGWRNLNSSCIFPMGLVDISVEFPDGYSEIETFYAINDLSFGSQNEELYSTEIICDCHALSRVEIEEEDNLVIEKQDTAKWKITKNNNSKICPSLCSFRIYKEGNPVLRLSVAIPFDGIMIVDAYGNIVPNGKIISSSNLGYYNIISHGGIYRHVDVTYKSIYMDESTQIKHLQSNVIEGLVSLADYSDLITRVFNLYGANSFDRTSSVVLNVAGNEVLIRNFILESTIEDGIISIQDGTQEDTNNFVYDGDIYAFPVGEEVNPEDFNTIKLIRENETENRFSFPETFTFKEVVVFSGPEVKRRIIPKYYNLYELDFDKSERFSRSKEVTQYWYEVLSSENIMNGKHWRLVCKGFEICSKNHLPFKTYNGLKSVAKDSKLFTKFVIAMWLNEYRDVLSQDIDFFEQEMEVALHWIPAEVWSECIGELLQTIPKPLIPMMMNKMQDLVSLLKDLFSSTVSVDIANDLATYLVSGGLESSKTFLTSEINNYKMKIHGITELNHDLPLIRFQLQGKYYPPQNMLAPYRVIIESAMCAAENACNLDCCTNLFSNNCRKYARIVNFYRKYFKETYSEIFFRTVKIILSKKN